MSITALNKNDLRHSLNSKCGKEDQQQPKQEKRDDLRNSFNIRCISKELIEHGQHVSKLEEDIQNLKKQVNNIKLAYVGKIVD